MLQLVLVVAYIAGCVALALRRDRAQGKIPSTLRGRARARGWGVRARALGWGGHARALGWGILLLPLALMVGGLFPPPASGPIAVLLLLAGIVALLWPDIAAKTLPVVLIGLGLYGLVVIRSLARGGWYASAYGLVPAGREWVTTYLLLLQVWAFLVLGVWLAWRMADRQSFWARLLLWEQQKGSGGERRPRWGLLLVPVMIMAVEMLGLSSWFGQGWWNGGSTAAAVLLALVLIGLFPAVAADLALAGLIGLGLYGVALTAMWPLHMQLPSAYTDQVRYGAVWVVDRPTAVLAGLQGLALLAVGVRLLPRALDARTRALFWPAPDAALAGRVQQLTQTRADAVDTAAAELRRVERDLHDGAQARLVAVGMNLRAAERLITSSPQAALALIAEARETSSKALTELRDLVRGIYPPVLADRGLPDAVRALALDTPLHAEVDIDVPGRLDGPVESACYFAVAEALANAVKHSGAQHVGIRMQHARGMLRIEVIDDGAGGADPLRGSGLRGLERRLGTFDGILAVSSPPGGPTMIVIEVPCALSSLKTSSC
jgi:signal transduction histidine kinase